MQRPRYIVYCLLFLIALANIAHAQNDPFRRMQGMGRGFGKSSGGGDSIAHRTGLEDSITINFRYLDSSRFGKFDSSITDFTKYIPVPWYYAHLGNLGTAANSIVFNPIMGAGFDPGFHNLDLYNFTLAQTRFFNTTRPYSEVGYMLGSQAEQMIHLMHTQNVTPNWNLGIQYRLINAPGFFQNQNTNHNNYRVSSWYQAKNKRYQNFVVVLGNKLQSSENGGIKQDGNYLDSVPYNDRAIIPTEIGPNEPGNRNFFSVDIKTGTRYTTGLFLLRQQYDLGQKDSLVTDSTVIPLFYPRVRLEHTISYQTYNYRFTDNTPDSAYYKSHYDIQYGSVTDTFFVQDKWKRLINDFSIYSFPDAKNPQQFVKAGAALENLTGTLDSGRLKKNYYNFLIHGEYRNKTRNQKWDVEANGRFYINGLNAGDYEAFISLKRLLSKKLGYLQLGFQNVNRTPSFVFNQESTLNLDTSQDFNKENIIHLFGSLEQPLFRFRLSASYYLVNNLAFFHDYFRAEQASSLFNVLIVTAEKSFRLSRRWNWRTWVVLQQRAGDAPVNLPLFFTRNQIGYDGSLGFKNLNLSTGLEFRYFTPYKTQAYSPLTGQFFYQDSTQVSMIPEIGFYMNLRIKTFTAYTRIDNLNTIDFSRGGFTNNNILIPGYPYPGLQIRVGIMWSFVN